MGTIDVAIAGLITLSRMAAERAGYSHPLGDMTAREPAYSFSFWIAPEYEYENGKVPSVVKVEWYDTRTKTRLEREGASLSGALAKLLDAAAILYAPDPPANSAPMGDENPVRGEVKP